MPKAVTDPTTPPATPPNVTLPPQPPMTGDALLLALAALYRGLTTAIEEFDEEGAHWKGTMHTYLEGHQSHSEHARDVITEAICVIQADGVPGAMIQLEAMYLDMESGNVDAEERYRQNREGALRLSAIRSIYNVLARGSGRTTSDCLNILPPWRDGSRTDMGALIAEWRTMLEGNGLEVGQRTARVRA